MPSKKKHHIMLAPSRKTFQNPLGKWVEKRTRTEILLCACGQKYIKTRKDQTVCIYCMYRTFPKSRSVHAR